MVNFNFTFEPGVTINQALSFEMAGKIWGHFLTDDISLEITVAATDQLPDDVLGGSLVSRQTIDLGTVEAALLADASSSNDAIAVNTLGQDGTFQGIVNDTLYEGDSIQLSQAQIKALGIPTPDFAEADGYIVFNSLKDSDAQWEYSLDRSTPASPDSVDHLSIALHEIGHILGFVSGLDAPNLGVPLETSTLLDLFRYSERSALSGSNELTPGVGASFSLDGGVTSLAPFSSGIVAIDALTQQGYQASHWDDLNASTEVLIESSGLNELLDLFFVDQSIYPNTVLTTPDNIIVTAASQAREITSFLIASSLTSQLVEEDNGINLGILDPTLALEERSNITDLDLTAFDILGYDRDNTADVVGIDYAQLLEQAKQTVSELSGLTRDELQLSLNQNLIIQGEMPQRGNSIQFEPDEIYERRRRRQRVTSNASFWQELDTGGFLQAYGSQGQQLLGFNDYLEGNTDALLNALDSDPESADSFTIITGNESDVVEGWKGQVSVNTGLGNDLIALGNKSGSYMAEAGDQDFLTVLDWNDRDFLLLHGDRSQYVLNKQSLYYQDDLIATFEGGIPFELDSNRVFYTDTLLGVSDQNNPDNSNELLFPVIDLFLPDLTATSVESFLSTETLLNQLLFLESFTGRSLDSIFFPDSLERDPLSHDTLNGGQGKDIILGSQNNELIYGRRGDDVLVGNSGNDTLFGQNGDDVISGTDNQSQGILEKDILIGGKGADLFILGDQQGAYYAQNNLEDQALIKDFSITEDRLQLYGSAADYQFKTVRNHTVILLEGDRIALIQGIQNFPTSSDSETIQYV